MKNLTLLFIAGFALTATAHANNEKTYTVKEFPKIIMSPLSPPLIKFMVPIIMWVFVFFFIIYVVIMKKKENKRITEMLDNLENVKHLKFAKEDFLRSDRILATGVVGGDIKLGDRYLFSFYPVCIIPYIYIKKMKVKMSRIARNRFIYNLDIDNGWNTLEKNNITLPTGSTYVWTHDKTHKVFKASAFVKKKKLASEALLITPEIDLTNCKDITFDLEDMASYDDKDKKAYVLEAGTYEISLQEDSHNILDTRTFPLEGDIVYNESNKRNSDKEVATNKLDDMRGNFTVLSRKDKFANLEEATKAPTDFALPEDKKAAFLNNSNYDASKFDAASDEMPKMGANNNLKLKDLRGLDYDDPKWEDLLDEMSFKDMSKLVALGGYQTVAIGRIGKVQTVDCDGPSSINNNFTKKGSIGLPATIMLANTFNTELAHSFGDSIGKMANEMQVSGWYAPAMNTHRNAFAGRNFEYYSEDPYLSGKLAAAMIKGIQSNGIAACVKHFAVN